MTHAHERGFGDPAMSTISKKIQLTTAVFAVAATAGIAPVALADPTDTDTGTSTASSTDSSSASVGSAAGQAPTRSNRKDRPRPGGNDASDSQTSSTPAAGGTTPDRASTDVSVPSKTAISDALGPNPLFQNPLIWFGQPNPTPPPSTPIYSFEPLANLPEFTRPMFGWMQGFNFEGCVLGLGTTVRGQTVVGPYGTSTTGVSSSGCA